jgi:hypothetical protein
MAITKTEAIRQLDSAGPNVANQQALVKKLSGTTLQKQIRHVIPGGAFLLDQISKEDLPAAIFTWLRRVAFFKDFTFSMCSDLSKVQTRQAQVVDFDTKQKQPEWEIQGKKWLAERMADVLREESIVALTVNKQGITAYQVVSDNSENKFGPGHELWEPNLTFTPFKPGV